MSDEIDDPELDCTDAAHPAWWRGHEHTAAVFCQLVNEILDGKPDSGGIASQPWEATRKRLHDLTVELAIVKARLAEIDQATKADADDLEKMRDGTKLTRAGCVQIIVYQRQDIDELKEELTAAKAECVRLRAI